MLTEDNCGVDRVICKRVYTRMASLSPLAANYSAGTVVAQYLGAKPIGVSNQIQVNGSVAFGCHEIPTPTFNQINFFSHSSRDVRNSHHVTVLRRPT